MTHPHHPTLRRVILTHFVPCFFIGVITLYMANLFLDRSVAATLNDSMLSWADFLAAGINGSIVAGLVALFHERRNAWLAKVQSSEPLMATRTIQYAAIAGFLAGALDILLVLHNEGILILTALVLVLLFIHLREFAGNLGNMLRPGYTATWGEVSELSRIYVTMLAGFTLVNAALEGAHLIAGLPAPFGFSQQGGDIFLNSLYFTVVTMTTLGYGDFTPKMWDAKLLAMIECLVSYVMFALMVGIVTRGVVTAKEKNEQ
ncbi:conserved membrane protein of unknown function [Pseudodesulfovibrio profundus]|uniref:Potassium channel domain-containing protein n=2 Tax=Pseudodesulfovibrio profundus TaxID=57320 RepID=A0A2C8FAH6_9BACT|nr:conserved membrane protein of unknown function [Pseudodesulfovibrio profundus]